MRRLDEIEARTGIRYVAGTTEDERWLLARLRQAEEALAAAEDALEYASEGEQTYGYYQGGDPRDFHPDPECCTAEEQAAHKAACEAWDRGERPDPGGPHAELTEQECADLSAAAGRTIGGGYKTIAHYGIGTTTYRDPALDGLQAKCRAALAAIREEAT